MSRNYKFNNPDGTYFVSFATVEWVDVFTRKDYRDIIIQSLKYCQAEKGLRVFAYVIMTNHIHLIIKSVGENTLSEILRDFKKFTSKSMIKAIKENTRESRRTWMLGIFKKAAEMKVKNKNYQFWRHDNKPIHVYSEKVIRQKLDYIHNNPVKAGIVLLPKHYLHSSASNYAGLGGLIDVSILE